MNYKHNYSAGFKYLLFLFFIFIQTNVSKSQNGISNDLGYYDLIEKGSFQIDANFEYDKSKFGGKILQNAELKTFNAPTITFRYGIFGNFEIQTIFGFAGINATGNGIINDNGRYFDVTANEKVFGLDAFSIAIKNGIISEQNLRPSISLTSVITLPYIGIDLNRPEDFGGEFLLDFHNTFSEAFDILYEGGIRWSGYEGETYPLYEWKFTPGVSISESSIIYFDYFGNSQKSISPQNYFDFGYYYSFSDFVEADIYLGSSFNMLKNYFFAGIDFYIIIP